jgi:hypothetical protein
LILRFARLEACSSSPAKRDGIIPELGGGFLRNQQFCT